MSMVKKNNCSVCNVASDIHVIFILSSDLEQLVRPGRSHTNSECSSIDSHPIHKEQVSADDIYSTNFYPRQQVIISQYV